MSESNASPAADQLERINIIEHSAQEFLSGEWSLSRFRELVDSGNGYDPSLWAKACELGWPAIMLSEAEGGSEGSFSELVAIAQQCGRALATTPLVSHTTAMEIARQAASPELRRELLDIAATGKDPLALAVLEPELVSDRRSIALVAKTDGSGWILNGAKRFVPAARSASMLIVAAKQEDGRLALLAVPRTADGVVVEKLKPLDWSAIDSLRFDNVRVSADRLVALGADAERLLGNALMQSDVLLSAEMCGVAESALDLAVEYAKVRMTYGKPIGQYQAVKHRLVNLRADIEIAKALIRSAANAIASGTESRHVSAAQVAYWSIDALKKVPEGCLQVFGGIGFTWEHDIHLYLRRCATLGSLMGERTEHREIIVNALDAAQSQDLPGADVDD